jgi:hypothetical protein
MKKGLLVLAVCASMLAVGSGTATADPSAINGSNCAGVAVSGLAAPGFGQFVSGFAQAGLVDNFGLADCGQPPRRNP